MRCRLPVCPPNQRLATHNEQKKRLTNASRLSNNQIGVSSAYQILARSVWARTILASSLQPKAS